MSANGVLKPGQAKVVSNLSLPHPQRVFIQLVCEEDFGWLVIRKRKLEKEGRGRQWKEGNEVGGTKSEEDSRNKCKRKKKEIFILSDENQCLLCLLGVNISYQNEISNNSGLAKGLGSLKET